MFAIHEPLGLPSYWMSNSWILDKTTEEIFSIWTCRILLKGDGNALFICQHWQRSACQWYLLQLNLLRSDRSRCTLACQTLVHTHHTAYRSTSKGEKAWVCRAEGEWGKHKLGGFSLKPAGLALFYRDFFTWFFWSTKPSAGADGYNFLEKQKKGTGEF